MDFFSHHVRGDWGELPQEDKNENQLSLEKGLRLLSGYRTTAGETFWVITEADRSHTTVRCALSSVTSGLRLEAWGLPIALVP